MNKYLKEFVLWFFIVVPYIYLATVWTQLPERVPTHFDLEGVPNGWSSKTTLLIIPGILGIGIYFLMLIVPALDPKGKIWQMGNKYYVLRLLLTAFISMLLTYLVHLSKVGRLEGGGILVALLGMLLALLGNYLPTIRPNYFIGIRTPWTLENDQIWRRTHLLAGRIWIIGGVVIVLCAFFVESNRALKTSFSILLSLMVLIPIVYSYIAFRRTRDTVHQ